MELDISWWIVGLAGWWVLWFAIGTMNWHENSKMVDHPRATLFVILLIAPTIPFWAIPMLIIKKMRAGR